MNIIVDSIRNLEVGEVQVYKNLAIAPILGNDSSLDYLVLAEAVTRGFQIDEDLKNPRVPYLLASNSTGRNVLAIAGDYVVGGRQNRALAQNIYFEINFNGQIPVRCIERGRWHLSPPSGKPEGSFEYLGTVSRHSARARSQAETWREAEMHLADSQVRSGSSDLSEVYRARREDFEKLKERFSTADNQVGMVAVFCRNGEKLFVADVFDKNAVLRKYFGGILESHFLDSGLDSKNTVELSREEAKGFLDSADTCNFTPINPVSLGQEYEMKKDNLLGSALVFENGLLYANLYTPKKSSMETLGQEEATPRIQRSIFANR